MAEGRREVLIVRRWTLRVGLVVILFMVVLGAWVVYTWGGMDAARELQELRAQREHLEARVQDLEAKNTELTRQLAMLKRARQIDQEAYSDYRQGRADLEATIGRLREELIFYRGIMAPEREKEGLQAQDFEIVPLAEAGHFRVRLVMVYLGRHERFRKGELELQVTGIRQGQETTYTHTELGSGDEADLDYGFRYFQVFEREWVMPADFEPRKVEVRAEPEGKGEAQTWTFPWQIESISTTKETGDVG